MPKYKQSRWSCQLCARTFPTSESLRADLEAHKVLVRDLLAELERSLTPVQCQPSSPTLESSDTSEAEIDKSLTMPTETTIKGPPNVGSNLRCPLVGCHRNQGRPYADKKCLSRHYTTHIQISEKCAFCMMSFDCLRYFVTHLDKNCKAKKDCKEKGIPENGKQRRSIRHKDSWCKLSNEQLNQQLAIIKGTKGEESSVAGDTRSDSNGMIKGRSKGATPESLASTNHRSGEGDEGSSESGSSIRSHPVINHKAAHPQLETSADETLQAENHRPLKKRRRTGTIVSTKPLSSAQMNQSHRVHENGDIGFETIAAVPDISQGKHAPLLENGSLKFAQRPQNMDPGTPLTITPVTDHHRGQINNIPQPSTPIEQDQRGTETPPSSVAQNTRELQCASTERSKTSRQIQFMFSKAPSDRIRLFSDLLTDAIQNSRQWKHERELGESTTECLTTMIPEDPEQDISITLWVGRPEGYKINEMIMLQRTWSAGHRH